MNFKKVSVFLNTNKVVIMPSDTIYGFFMKISNNNLKFLNNLKKSPDNKPLIILFSSIKQLMEYVNLDEKVFHILKEQKLDKITFIIDSNQFFSDKYLMGNDLIAFRIVSEIRNKDLFKVIKDCGPLYTTSVNFSKTKILNKHSEIKRVFGGNINIHIVKGTPISNVPSRILKITDDRVELIRDNEGTSIQHNR